MGLTKINLIRVDKLSLNHFINEVVVQNFAIFERGTLARGSFLRHSPSPNRNAILATLRLGSGQVKVISVPG